MKRRTLSLLLALCCLLGTVLPMTVAAEEAEAAAVEFSDDFESETVGAAPTKWQVVEKFTYKPTIEVKEENGNKFMRITSKTATHDAKHEQTVSTRDGLLNLKLKDGTQKIIVEARIRTQNSNMRKSLRLGCADDDYGCNKYNLIQFRNADGNFQYLNGHSGSGDEEQTTMTSLDGFKSDANTWYDVCAVINPVNGAVRYTLTDVTTNEVKTVTGLMDSSEYDALDAITGLYFRFVTPVENEYMDVDNIKAYYMPAAPTSFEDNFEADTENAMPKNWQTVDNGKAPNVTVVKEGDNKFMRITATATGDAANTRPTVQTKEDLFGLKLKDGTQKIIVEARVRTANSGMRKSLRLGYTDNDWDCNQYNLFAFRNAVGNFTYLNGSVFDGTNTQTSMATLSDFENDANAWYDVKTEINPTTKAVHYTLTKVSTETTYTAIGRMDSPEFNALETITSLNFRFVSAVADEAMDVDNVKIYYKPAAPSSFADDFETEVIGRPAKNWEDRNGHAAVTVKADKDGNHYANISWNASETTATPIVATKEDSFTVPMKSGYIVVEARMRITDTNYRDYLRVNFPENPVSMDHAGNRYALWWANPTNENAMFNYLKGDTQAYAGTTDHQPSFISKPATECPSVGKWFTYRAVIQPKEGMIRHEINGSHKGNSTEYLNVDEFKNMSALSALMFTFRNSSGGGYTSSLQNGSMDFDDVRVYNYAEAGQTITYEKDGNVLTKAEAGAATVCVRIDHVAADKQVDYYVYTALYEGDKLIDAVLTGTTTVGATTAKEIKAAAPTITDPTKQSLKTFIWTKDALSPICGAATLPKAE